MTPVRVYEPVVRLWVILLTPVHVVPAHKINKKVDVERKSPQPSSKTLALTDGVTKPLRPDEAVEGVVLKPKLRSAPR